MATQSREPTTQEELERGLLGQIEVHSIDWIPDTERHGKTWQQAMLWFLGNFQYFTIPIGFVGPALGLSLGWSILAGVLGIGFGTLFMAFHATQGPVFGLPQMIQTGRGLQHHLRAVRVGLLPLHAAQNPGPRDHRRGVLRRLGLGGLADRAGRLAGHPPEHQRRPGRPAGGRRQRGRPAGLDHRVPVGDGAAGHHGHERLRRNADRADRDRLVQDAQDQSGLACGDRRSAGGYLVCDRREHLHQRVQHRGQRRTELAEADALPAGAVDRAEPGGLLLRPPRALRDHRHLPPGRGSTAPGAGAA